MVKKTAKKKEVKFVSNQGKRQIVSRAIESLENTIEDIAQESNLIIKVCADIEYAGYHITFDFSYPEANNSLGGTY
jgi:hypothetical protein